jgi:hypothetical protein
MMIKVGEFVSSSNNIKARTSGYKIQRGKEYRRFMMIDDFQSMIDDSPYLSTHPSGSSLSAIGGRVSLFKGRPLCFSSQCFKCQVDA